MNKRIKPYPLGYVFSEFSVSKEKLPNHYNYRLVANTFHYYYDPEVNPAIYEINDYFILIHGHYVHAAVDNSIENKDLPQILLEQYVHNYSNYLDLLDFIGGRFVILIGNSNTMEIFPDATNSRSTYFKTDSNICSSHAHLLGDIFDLEKIERKKYLNNNLLMSPFKTVQSVFPNYKLNLFSKEYERFFPRRDNIYKKMSEKEKFELIEIFWDKQLKYYFNHYNNFIFSLTGGGDSRFSFSLIQEYKDKVNFFTYASTDKEDYSTEESSMLSIDYAIVKQLLDHYNIKHSFFYFDQLTNDLNDYEIEILSKNSINKHTQNMLPFIHHQYPYNNLMHIRANLLELGQARDYRNRYVESTKTIAKEKYMERTKKVLGTDFKAKEIENQYDLFVKKLNFGENIFDYHIMDINYWEVRMGRWHAEVINNHDILFDTISPYNHRALIDVTLAFPYKKRKSEYVFKEIINRNTPILNFFGDNNIKNIYEQNRELILNPPKTTTVNKLPDKNIFKSFLSFDKNGNSRKVYTNDNKLFIPKELLLEKSFSEIEFIFSKKQGIAYIILVSKFGSQKNKNIVFYEIFKNDILLLTEDVANWSLPNSISIENLKKNDRIKIRIVIRKKLSGDENWQKATTINILDYIEINSLKKNNRLINYSSPYSLEQ